MCITKHSKSQVLQADAKPYVLLPIWVFHDVQGYDENRQAKSDVILRL